jgi:hypothetical protein
LYFAVLDSRVCLSHWYCASPRVMPHMSRFLPLSPGRLSTGTLECQSGSIATNSASPQVHA